MRVVCPPYDVIGPELHEQLLRRSPRNAVRIDLPEAQPRDEPEDRYRRAGKLLTDWRADGTLHKDRYPCIYVYEQTYAVPGTRRHRTQRGLLRPPQARNLWARRRRPAARTDALGAQRGPLQADEGDQREHQPRGGAVRGSDVAASVKAMRAIAATPPDIEVTDDDGVRHRALGRDRERTLRRSGPRPPGRGRTRADHHRRRPPPLRDGDPLPRREARPTGPARRTRPRITC